MVETSATASAVKKLGFFKGVRGEFKKIIWPNFNTLTKQTGTVIAVSLATGLVISGIDFLLNQVVYKFLLQL
ncbi:preprotein translocase subunit SecE [Anaerotalea alkaliphila]|uniref:Protein translocase subunit SecE n=1 Tax=Anaerotalea alkaliphila TaxID=2662126 RepID=A0A7X5HXZ7_9FIRM|nr:preprotein translocase subunit SecE [Anaerotalea alkaliphila]NDL68661.1 preprotein translocase subunit SecE [Anaerotalea alkaliphila]